MDWRKWKFFPLKPIKNKEDAETSFRLSKYLVLTVTAIFFLGSFWGVIRNFPYK